MYFSENGMPFLPPVSVRFHDVGQKYDQGLSVVFFTIASRVLPNLFGWGCNSKSPVP